MGFSALGALLLVGTAAGGTGGFRGIGGFDGFDGLGAFGVGKSPSSAHGRANGPSGRGSRPPAPSILSAPQAPPLAPPPVPPPSAATPPEEKSPGTEAPRQPAPDGNLIRNGYFAETTKPWLSEGEVWLRTDRDRLRISVDADEGGEAWDRRVLQRFAALRDDRRYTLKFAAAADSDITIRVVVYRESDPLTPVFDEDVDLDRRMHRFTFSFGSYLTTGEPIVGFEVGGHDAEHTVWVDGVSLVERG
jgi:hypothetical protein